MSDRSEESPLPLVDPSPDIWAPEQLLDDRFQIVRELGRGGMGAVYVAFDRELCREVALKRMIARRGDVAHEERFRREYRALASIRHPGVPCVHHSGRAPDGSPWFSMEIVQGESLRALLARARLAPLQALDLAIELGTILAAAHEVGVVHRDVKPNNIMIEAGGRVRLLDFGVCTPLAQFLMHAEPRRRTADVDRWHTQDGMFAGTFGYSDPATFDGTPATLRSDIFSLAAILYEMLTGRRLFDPDAMCYHSIDSAEFPGSLASLAGDLRLATARNPFERPRSMAQFVQRLEIGRGNMLRIQAEHLAARQRAVVALLGAVFLALFVLVAVLLATRQPRDLSAPSSNATGGPSHRDSHEPSAATGPAQERAEAPPILGEPPPALAPAASAQGAPGPALPSPADGLPVPAASVLPASPAAGSMSIAAGANGRLRRRLAARTPRVEACAQQFGAPSRSLAVRLRRDAAGRLTDVTLDDGPWLMLRRCMLTALSDVPLPPGGSESVHFTFHLTGSTAP